MTVLAAGRVVTGTDVHAPGWVAYEADKITAVGTGRADRLDLDLGADAVVVPGFVDLHVHGGGGGSFYHGRSGFRPAGRPHPPGSWHHGHDGQRGHGQPGQAARLGLHAGGPVRGRRDRRHPPRGPWISADRCGAHDPTQLRDPDPAEIARLIAAGRGAIAMVTLAPELPGGLDAIRQVVDAGAIAAVGHTDANYDIVVQAIAAGARVGTHLFNAMRPVHHRQPGPIVALLEDPRVTVELIADGIHLHPALYRHISDTTDPDRVALVTDAMVAAAFRDGTYQLGPMQVTVTDGVAHLTGTDTIAGSTTTTDRLFRAAAADPTGAVPDSRQMRRSSEPFGRPRSIPPGPSVVPTSASWKPDGAPISSPSTSICTSPTSSDPAPTSDLTGGSGQIAEAYVSHPLVRNARI